MSSSRPNGESQLSSWISQDGGAVKWRGGDKPTVDPVSPLEAVRSADQRRAVYAALLSTVYTQTARRVKSLLKQRRRIM